MFAVQLGALACRRAGKSNTRPGRFAYVERDQRDKERPGKMRGVNVARMDIARKLTQAIWHTTYRSRTRSNCVADGVGDLRRAS